MSCISFRQDVKLSALTESPRLSVQRNAMIDQQVCQKLRVLLKDAVRDLWAAVRPVRDYAFELLGAV